MKQINRRRFMKFTGLSLGIGTLYRVIPALGADSALGGFLADMRRSNGESMSPFTFIQLSDSHVGFNGPPNPTGTAAFERAVEVINGLPQTPELVLFTGDLTHDSEDKDVHAARMAQFRKIAGGIKAPKLRFVPGEHDAGLDGGILFRENFGETHYSFDHRGIHFVALDNVSLGRPMVGAAQLAWLQNDLARFGKTTPIVVFTHRPLFDLRPDWEWFTSDSAAVTNVVAPSVIEVSAKRFEFTPKEIHLRAGEPVTIRLVSTDRAHGLMVKELGIELDAEEGRPDSVTIAPARAGTYAAICDHYCGSGHGGMRMTFIVE